MPFSLTFQYIKGRDNCVADALSRCPAAVNTVTLVKSLWVGLLHLLQAASDLDPEYRQFRDKVDAMDPEYVVRDRLVQTHSGQWVVPQSDAIRTFLLAEAHDTITSGHAGIDKTLRRLREKWIWKGDANEVQEYVRSCVRCQKTKSDRKRRGGVLCPILASEPGQIVTLDFVSKFEPAEGTGHQQCIVIVDKFSRFVFFEGCPMEVTAQRTAELFCKRIVPVLGVPRKVISDRGPQFTAALWREFLNILGAKCALATAHHPQTDGQSERAIQELLRFLRSYAHEHRAQWERMLPLFETALNTSVSVATGFTPRQLLFVFPARMPFDHAFEEGESEDGVGVD